jgi:hypothetical protein
MAIANVTNANIPAPTLMANPLILLKNPAISSHYATKPPASN